MSHTRERHLLLSATVGIVLIGAVGSLHTGDLPGNGDHWSLGLVSVGYAWLGWVVAGRRPELPIGWLLLAGGAVNAAGFASNWWAVESLLVDPGSLPGGAVAAWAAVWLTPMSLSLVVIVPLVLFPDGRPRSRRWRRFLLGVGGAIAALALAAAVAAVPAALGPRPVSLLDVPGVVKAGWGGAAIAVASVAMLVSFGGVVASLGGIVWARRSAEGDERNAYTTVLFGAATVVVTFAVGALVGPLSGQQDHAPEALYSAAFLAIPASIAVAVIRFRAYELRAAVNRSVLVVLTVGTLALLYLAVLAVLAAVADTSTVLSVPSALAAGVVVLASAPIAAWGRRATRRWFGRATRPGLIADRFGDGLATNAEADQALRVLAAALRDELRLGSVSLAIDGLPRCVVGEPEPDVTRFALVYGQQPIGEIEVCARAGESLGRPDLRLLGELVAYIAVAAEAIRVSEDLRLAQHALEIAHAEERRRVRRDLHDGVAPTLASIRLKLNALRRAHPDGTLDEVVDQAADTLREVRRIVDGLQPSVLEDLGLLPALQILVADVRQTTGLVVVFDAPGSLPELPADTANTAYRVVSEALANVARHSQAGACTVRVGHTCGMLEIAVVDDGRGFDAAVSAGGMGLRNIATRASLAQGSASIVSAPGAGTTITVRVPA